MSRLDIIELKLDFLTHQLLHFISCFDTKRCECKKCAKFTDCHQLPISHVGNGHTAEPLKSGPVCNTSVSGLRKSSCASDILSKVPKVLVRKSSDHILAKNAVAPHTSSTVCPSRNCSNGDLEELIALKKEAAFTALLKTAAEKLEVGDYANGISSEMSTEHSGSGCSSVNHTDENFEDSLNMEPPKLKQRRKASMPVKIALMPHGVAVVKSPSESDLTSGLTWESSANHASSHRSDSVGTLVLGIKRKCSDELDSTSQSSSFSTEELSEQLITGFDANTTPQSSDMKSCHICGKLLHRGYLPNHIRAKHQNNQPAACNFCGKEFSFVSNLYRHLRKIHKATHHDNNALVGGSGGAGGIAATGNGLVGFPSGSGINADKSVGSDGEDDDMIDKHGPDEEIDEDCDSPNVEALETNRLSPPQIKPAGPGDSTNGQKPENVRKSGVVIANDMSQRFAGRHGYDVAMLGSFAADLVQVERAKMRSQGADTTMRRVQKIMETLAPI